MKDPRNLSTYRGQRPLTSGHNDRNIKTVPKHLWAHFFWKRIQRIIHVSQERGHGAWNLESGSFYYCSTIIQRPWRLISTTSTRLWLNTAT